MFTRITSKLRNFKLSMKMKLTFSLSAIVVILLISSIISIFEYSRMSNYVSDLISANIKSINVAQEISKEANDYNLSILAVIGDDNNPELPKFNQNEFVDCCNTLRNGLVNNHLDHLTDSIMYAYSAYMLTSMELPKVMKSTFINTRTWYFERLQPVYNRLMNDLDKLNNAVYNDLKKNSATFERGFYRSIIPGVVAVLVGVGLVLLLLFFILVYYVNPVSKMLYGLNNYRSYNKKYTYNFDGDDQLCELNDGIVELANENQQLRKRIKTLRESIDKRNIES